MFFAVARLGTLLISALLAASCVQLPRSGSIAFENEVAPQLRPPQDHGRTAAEAVSRLDVTGAAGTPFEAALRAVRAGDYGTAIAALQPLMIEEDAERTPLARRVVGQLLVHESRWSELRELLRRVPATGAGDFMSAYADAPAEFTRYGEPVSVLPLARGLTGSPIVQVDIGAVRRGLWLDTGAGMTVLSASLARQVGVLPLSAAAGPAASVTGASVRARAAIIPSLRIGALEVRNHPALILDDEDLTMRIFGISAVRIDGIIGWNLLQRMDLEFDLDAQRLTVHDPGASSKSLAPRNLVWLGYPAIFALASDGRELLLGLDTGAQRSVFSPQYVDELGLVSTGERERTLQGAGGATTVTVRQVPLTRFFVGNTRVTMKDAEVRVLSSDRLLALHGVLGSDVLNAAASVRLNGPAGRIDILTRRQQ